MSVLEKKKVVLKQIDKKNQLLLGEATYDQIGHKYGFAKSKERLKEVEENLETENLIKKKKTDNIYHIDSLIDIVNKHGLLYLSPSHFEGDILPEHMQLIDEDTDSYSKSTIKIVSNFNYTKYAIFAALDRDDTRYGYTYLKLIAETKNSPFNLLNHILATISAAKFIKYYDGGVTTNSDGDFLNQNKTAMLIILVVLLLIPSILFKSGAYAMVILVTSIIVFLYNLIYIQIYKSRT